MPRDCKTCKSPYVEEIDQMILAGWDIKEIYRILKGKYPNAVLPSYDSILNHSNEHVKGVIERGVASSTEKQRLIRQEIRSSVLAAKQLRKNLNIAAEGLDTLWKEWIATRDYNKLRNLGGLIANTNKSIELLLRFQKEISENQLTEDEVFDRIIYCIQDFPTEYIEKFKSRWEQWESYEHR